MKTHIELEELETLLRLSVPAMNKKEFNTFVKLCSKYLSTRKRLHKREKTVLRLHGDYDVIRGILKSTFDITAPEFPNMGLTVNNDKVLGVVEALTSAGVSVVEEK